MGEIGRYLLDVGGYLRAAAGVGAHHLPGRGADYEHDRFKRAARRMVERVHPDRMRMKVVEIIAETPSTKTFRLERVDGPLPPFRAGQYVNLKVVIGGVRTNRAYSISSPPGRGTIDLTVKAGGEGFVASYLANEVKVGDELVTSGPSGQFYHEPLIHPDRLVFIAAGSGITPIMSMIRHNLGQDLPLRMQLLYGSRTPDEVIFGRELRELAAADERLELFITLSAAPPGYEGACGRLSPEMIEEQVGDPEGKVFFICGPAGLYGLCEATLTEMGVPRHRIRRESYGPPSPVSQAPGWPEEVSLDTEVEVEVENRKTFKTTAGEPLLNALERQGLAVPALCRTGECSTCRVKLLEGEVYLHPEAWVRESDRAHGYLHSCVTYPLSDLKIRL